MEGRYFEFWVNGIIEDNTDNAGIFSLIADSQEEVINKFAFSAIHNSKITDYDLTIEGDDFCGIVDHINSEINENDSKKEFIEKIYNQFDTNFNGEKIKKIFEIITASRDPFLKNVLIKDIMEEVFRKIYKKSNLKIEVKYSLVNVEENIMDLVEENNVLNEETSSKSKLIKIKVNPILDPIDGIPVNKLKLGDEIHIRIVDSNIDTAKLEDVIYDKNSDAAKTTYVGKVTSVNRLEASGSIQITVGLGDLYVGDAALQDELKISAVQNTEKQAENDVDINNYENDTDYEEKMPIYLYFIIGAVSIGVFITLYFLFFS
ncbi:MAG: hypothetical protein M0R46_02625 [Candidatus Muirbacterium halophilum]|nr:hypothetical protein [Candidatus Muirbacterium halophilum]MCK9474785.1 hypothetical protein [Candidatus Muirbacterium halophilum]